MLIDPCPPGRKGGPLMRAHDLLAEAGELVAGDRERTHGDKLANFENIASRSWKD